MAEHKMHLYLYKKHGKIHRVDKLPKEARL